MRRFAGMAVSIVPLLLALESRPVEVGAQELALGGVELDENSASSGVYLPTDRSLSRAMARARERLAEREFHQALTFLQDVLTREEDSFLEQFSGDPEQQGLKATARRLIGELPPEGRDAYELLNSAAARRSLEAAIESGQRDRVAQVVRQFYHTSAGYEATLVLAQMEADCGHHLAAAQLYQELIETPRAARQFEPQLSLKAAVNLLAAGRDAEASKTLRSLIAHDPSAAVKLLGRSHSLPEIRDDPAAWLRDTVGRPLATQRGESSWLTLRGNPSRNARPAGGPPHLRIRWQARVVNDPTVEAYLTNKTDQLAQRGAVTIPGARPIAVRDVVVMRTPYNVVAVDWHTGKRIWETREDDELDADEVQSGLLGGGGMEDAAAQDNELEQRIWDDALVNSLASDGDRVFVIRSPTITPQEEQMTIQMGGMNAFGVEPIASANRLAAYDLATQGKLLWELNGNSNSGPMAGAFFLGAPLAIDNTLFVMAEIRSAVYLLALEPSTGKLVWQQQLVGLEQGIALDPARRLVAATPSYSAGILVCPTSAGAVVAIDVIKRELSWVYRYPRESASQADMRPMWQVRMQNPLLRINNRWRNTSAIIADGRVLVTPPESNDLHCLDLRTGQRMWRYRQGGAHYVACVDDDRVLLVGKDSIQARRLDDKSPAWDEEVLALPPGALPAGEGYLSSHRYYLPVTTGGVVTIDVAAGKVLPYSPDANEPVLGNLICYRGSVLSQTAVVLDKFEQSDVLRERAEAALAKNPDDATALRELAEMRRVAGNTAEAVELLKRAVELAPGDPLAEQMLSEVLLEALASDFASHYEDVPLLRRVIRGREQQIELLRIEARGLEKMGRRLPAFEAYLRLVEYTELSPTQLRVTPTYQVRSDRWISGRLARMWSAASEAERATIADELTSRRPPVDHSASAANLHHYLAHFGGLPGAGDLRLRLARWLLDRGREREAEIEILALGASPDEEDVRTATVLMAQLLVNAGTPEEAAPLLNMLADRWKDTQMLDGLTGREWFDRLMRDTPKAPISATGPWPSGHVDVGVNLLSGAGRSRAESRNRDERQPGLRQLNIEQNARPAVETIQWFVSTDATLLIGRDRLGSDVLNLPVEPSVAIRPGRDTGYLPAAQLGHLLFVSIGGQILAVDSRSGGAEGSVLWRAYPMGRYPVNLASLLRSRNGRTAGIGVYDVQSSRRRTPGSRVSAAGALGPATARGVVFQELNDLKSVDPLTGEILWKRSDLPTGGELFGDQELVFAADPSAGVVHIFQLADGRLVARRALPEIPWMLAAGRNVAQRRIDGTGSDRKMNLRVTNVATNEVLFDADFDDQSKMVVVEPRAIAVYEPLGRFQLVDVQTGTVQIDQQLVAAPEAEDIRTLVSGDQLFLVVNSRSLVRQNVKIAPMDVMVNGQVYAFDITSGEPLWPGPAIVRNRALVMGQPPGIPLLVFVDHKATRNRNTGGGQQLQLLCLDKRTGRTVYRNDELPSTSSTRFRIRGELGTEPRVALETSAAEIYLTMTDRPRPPQPPGNDELEVPRANAERGLWGVAGRMSEALQNALEGRSGNRPQNSGPEEMDDD